MLLTAASYKQTFKFAIVKVFTQQILPGNEIERNSHHEGVFDTSLTGVDETKERLKTN